MDSFTADIWNSSIDKSLGPTVEPRCRACIWVHFEYWSHSMASILENSPRMTATSLLTQVGFKIHLYFTMRFGSAHAWLELFKISRFLRAFADLLSTTPLTLALRTQPLSAYSFVQMQLHGFGPFDDHQFSSHQRQNRSIPVFCQSGQARWIINECRFWRHILSCLPGDELNSSPEVDKESRCLRIDCVDMPTIAEMFQWSPSRTRQDQFDGICRHQNETLQQRPFFQTRYGFITVSCEQRWLPQLHQTNPSHFPV